MKKIFSNNLLKNNNGAAIILTIMVVFVLFSFGVILNQYFITQLKFTKMDEDSMKAFNIAKSVASSYAEFFVSNPNNLPTNELVSKLALNETGTGTLNGHNFSVQVIDGGATAKIRGSCTINNITKKIAYTIKKPLTTNDLFDNAVFCDDDLECDEVNITNNDGSKPSVGSNGTIIAQEWAEKVEYEPDREFSPVIVPTFASKIDIPLDNIITESGYYNDFQVNNVDLYINTGATVNDKKTIVIVIDTLTTKGDIYVEGYGRAYLYVNTLFAAKTGKSDINIKPDKLIIMLKSGAELNMKANADLDAYVYGPEASIVFENGIPNARINGAIICQSFEQANSNSGNVNYIPPGDLLDWPWVPGSNPFTHVVISEE
jgi:hypothetical protein